jgi:hypothetical protein
LDSTTHCRSSYTLEAIRTFRRQVLLSVAIAQIQSCACLAWSLLNFK